MPSNNMEERELLEGLKRGDENAYRQFMAVHKDAVYRIIHSFSGMASEIDDIAQDVFITVFRKIRKFRGGSSLSTWLYRVTINKCKDYLRKRRPEMVELSDRLTEPAADMSAAAMNGALAEKLLEALPEKFRSVVILRELEGMSYDEIAGTLKIPLGRVKIMLFRARKKMKEAALNGM